MSFTINTNFNKYQVSAYPGMQSKPDQPWQVEVNNIIAGETLIPGQGVYLNGSGLYVKPTTAPLALDVRGVVFRRVFDSSVDGSNQYLINTNFELFTAGNIFVTVGVNVLRGQIAGMSFDGSGKWVIGSEDQALVFVYEDDALADTIVSIKTVGQIKAFP